MKKLFSFLMIIFAFHGLYLNHAHANSSLDIVTNPPRKDGFGSQFQTIIYSVIYADLNNKKFLYTPFQSMEHNYDNDPDFLEKKEKVINFIGNFELNHDLGLQSIMAMHIDFFEHNLEACANSQSLKKIKANIIPYTGSRL